VATTPTDPFVTYRDPGGRAHVHVLRSSPVTVGRSSSADICLSWDAHVSRMHARLELVGDDPTIDWTVVDDGSSRNGSYLNGERLRGRARLREGDGVSVGETLLVFRVGTVEGPADESADKPGAGLSTATMFGRPHVTRDSLSDSQYRVLVALAGRGDAIRGETLEPASDEEIAGRLFLNVDTVRAHLQVLYERFGVATLPPEQRRVALVSTARIGGLLLPERDR
jgi:hypothetical protein